jgi:hypothetical protein
MSSSLSLKRFYEGIRAVRRCEMIGASTGILLTQVERPVWRKIDRQVQVSPEFS